MEHDGGPSRGIGELDGPAATLLGALGNVYDPCCEEKQISIVDMGLVNRIDVSGDQATVELILTSGWCPFAVDLVGRVQEVAEAVPGIRHADIQLGWDEAWGTHRLSDDARAKLRFLPEPGEVPNRDAYIAVNLPTRPTTSGVANP